MILKKSSIYKEWKMKIWWNILKIFMMKKWKSIKMNIQFKKNTKASIQLT